MRCDGRVQSCGVWKEPREQLREAALLRNRDETSQPTDTHPLLRTALTSLLGLTQFSFPVTQYEGYSDYSILYMVDEGTEGLLASSRTRILTQPFFI